MTAGGWRMVSETHRVTTHTILHMELQQGQPAVPMSLLDAHAPLLHLQPHTLLHVCCCRNSTVCVSMCHPYSADLCPSVSVCISLMYLLSISISISISASICLPPCLTPVFPTYTHVYLQAYPPVGMPKPSDCIPRGFATVCWTSSSHSTAVICSNMQPSTT